MKVEVVASTEANVVDTIPGYVCHWEIGRPETDFEPVPPEEDAELEEAFRLGETYYRFTEEHEEWLRSRPSGPDELAEAAGRLCYKSWNRPNPKTATTSGYISNIINQKHFSVLEHASVSFYVGEVSRSLLAELTRHRHLSFSVVSQRYVNHSDSDWVDPPVFDQLDSSDSGDLRHEMEIVMAQADAAYSYIKQSLLDRGIPRKQAYEAARAVLPQATATEFIVTGNLRAWREVLEKRLSPGADAEIQQLARELLYHLKKYAPATFQDFNEGE